MRTIYFASVCGATLLAVTGFANAQGTGVNSSSDQGVTSKQCWDVSSNIVREKNPTGTASEKTPKTTVGSSMSNSTSSGASGSASSTGNASARPAGMPDC